MIVGDAPVTANAAPSLTWPPTITTTLPLVAPTGTGTTIFVLLQLLGVAATPLNQTRLAPTDVPKLLPTMVTGVPAGPDTGARLVILGAVDVTVNGLPLLATPPTVTTTVPARLLRRSAPAATMLVALQLVGDGRRAVERDRARALRRPEVRAGNRDRLSRPVPTSDRAS